MGRGSKSHESGVKKDLEEFSPEGSGGGKVESSESNNSCLFSFQASLIVSQAEAIGLSEGMAVRLNQSYKGEQVEVIVGTQVVGLYTGTYLTRVKNCIKRNYIYEGNLVKIDKSNNQTSITIELVGKGR